MNLRKEARNRPCMVRIPGVCDGGGETTVLAQRIQLRPNVGHGRVRRARALVIHDDNVCSGEGRSGGQRLHNVLLIIDAPIQCNAATRVVDANAQRATHDLGRDRFGGGGGDNRFGGGSDNNRFGGGSDNDWFGGGGDRGFRCGRSCTLGCSMPIMG